MILCKMEPTITSLRKKFIIGIIVGVFFTAVLIFGLDFLKLVNTIRRFELQFIPIILSLIFSAFLGRFIKWQLFLKELDVSICWKDSVRIFFAGLSMTITPGKAGEVFKAFLLKQKFQIDFCRTSSTIVAERLTGLIGAIILSGISIYFSDRGLFTSKFLVLFALLFIFLAIIGLRNRFIILIVTAGMRKTIKKWKRLSALLIFYKTARRLTREPLFSKCICLSAFSWLCEATILFLALYGLGIKIPWIEALLIYTVSSMTGGLSMLPGGVGAAELSMVSLLTLLGVDQITALGATLIVRFTTIWFGVMIGILITITNWTTFKLDELS